MMVAYHWWVDDCTTRMPTRNPMRISRDIYQFDKSWGNSLKLQICCHGEWPRSENDNAYFFYRVLAQAHNIP
jgi:hypothetical protein